MIRECFWWFITLCRNRPFEATVLSALALVIICACVHSAFFPPLPREYPENTDRHNY